jgi:hypothetical protein
MMASRYPSTTLVVLNKDYERPAQVELTLTEQPGLAATLPVRCHGSGRWIKGWAGAPPAAA